MKILNGVMNGFIFICVLSSSNPARAELSGLDVMKKNEAARKIEDYNAKSSLIKQDSSSKKEKEFTMWRKLKEGNSIYYSLTRFHKPSEVRDEGVLFLEKDEGSSDILLYLPAYKKIRRVETQQQSGSFMGSDFSYSDITSPHLSDYTYQVLRKEKCGTNSNVHKESANQNCYVVQCLPAKDLIKEKTGYSKSVVWVRDDSFLAVAGEYYDLQGKFFKKMASSDFKVVSEKGGEKKWMAHKIDFENLKTKSKTTLQFQWVKANQGLGDSLFTQQNLSNVR